MRTFVRDVSPPKSYFKSALPQDLPSKTKKEAVHKTPNRKRIYLLWITLLIPVFVLFYLIMNTPLIGQSQPKTTEAIDINLKDRLKEAIQNSPETYEESEATDSEYLLDTKGANSFQLDESTSAESQSVNDTVDSAHLSSNSSLTAGDNHQADSNNLSQTIPSSKHLVNNGAKVQLPVKLYFVEHNNKHTEIKPVFRTLEFPNTANISIIAKNLLEVLLAGPTSEEQRNNIISLIPDGSSLLSMSLKENGHLLLNFNETFTMNPLSLMGAQLQIVQLMSTLLQLQGINKIQFLVEGREFVSSEGLDIYSIVGSSPISKYLYVDLKDK